MTADPPELDPVSQRVKAQYENFPYPHHPVGEKVAGLAVAASFELAQYARLRRLLPHKGKRALIAGCGTGFELHATKVFNPDFAELIGVDFSEASLTVARQRIAHHGLAHVSVRYANLMDAGTLPAGEFDYIGSHGVLHHLKDPAVGLKNLAGRLAPGGVMAIMLYNGAGRWPLYQVRRALSALGLDSMPQAEALGIVKEMIKHAEPNTLFHMVTRGEVNDEYYAHDANIVDNLLHPQDLPFSAKDLPTWLASAGLEFIEMADEKRWRLSSVLGTQCKAFYQRIASISGLERLAVVEGLDPLNNTEMIFWACRHGELENDFFFTAPQFVNDRWTVAPPFLRHAHVATRAAFKPADVAARLVNWPLFYPTGQAVWPESWQQITLDVIANQPMTGAEILNFAAERALGPAAARDMASPAAASVQSEVLRWFSNWERDRVVMRL